MSVHWAENKKYFNFSYDDENNRWIAEHAKYPAFLAVTNAGLVLGKQEWAVSNDSKMCGSSSYTTKLSFSSCSLNQFTCNDGNCVDMDKR